MRIWMDPEFGSISNLVYFGDEYDADEMDFIRRYLRPGDTVIDAGANVGTYTLLSASVIGRTGKVHAFEPAPAMVDALRRNVELNDLADVVQIHQMALTDRTGELGFRADWDVSSRIAVDGDPSERVTLVPCGRIDDVLHDEDVCLAKIDVEGAEAAALRGFREHLGQGIPPVLLLEILSNQLEHQGSSVDEVVTLLDDSGYDLVRYCAHDTSLRPTDPTAVHGNIFAVHRASRAHVEERLGLRPPN